MDRANEASQTPGDLVRDVIRDWAHGSSTDLASLRRKWERLSPTIEFYTAASAAVLPIFDRLVKHTTDHVERERGMKELLSTAAEDEEGALPRTGELGDNQLAGDVIPAVIAPQKPPGWASFVPFEGGLDKQDAQEKSAEQMAAVAVTFSNSSAVAGIAKLHAHLVANGICGSFTRSRCLYVLVQACSLYSVSSYPVGRRHFGVKTDLDTTVFHVGCVRDGDLTAAHVAGHAVRTLRALQPFLEVLPHPLSKAMHRSPVLRILGFTCQEDAAEDHGKDNGHACRVPRKLRVDWTPSSDLPLLSELPDFDESAHDLGQDSLHKLQILFDSILHLRRTYCGDIGSSGFVSVIDLGRIRGVADALTESPDIVDDVASILVDLFVTSIAGRDMESPGWKKLGSPADPVTLELPNASSTTTVAGEMYKQLRSKTIEGQNASTAAGQTTRFKELPDGVKAMFSDNVQQEFFLVLLLEMSTHSFFDAMAQRLSMRLYAALSSASSAPDTRKHSRSILEVHTLCKFLAVVLHSPHWHLEKKINKKQENQLKRLVRTKTRSASKRFTHFFDVAGMLTEACATASPLATRAAAVAVAVSITLAKHSVVARNTQWFARAIRATTEAIGAGDVTSQMLFEDVLEDVGEEVYSYDRGFLSEDGHAQESLVCGNQYFVEHCAPRMAELVEMVKKGSETPWTRSDHGSPPPTIGPSEGSLSDRLHSASKIGLSPQLLEIAEMVVAAGYKDPKKAGRAFELAAGLLLDPHGEQRPLHKSTIAAVIKEASKMATGKPKEEARPDKNKAALIESVLEGKEPDDVAASFFEKYGVAWVRNAE